jgi:signal transduction histidine kinase
MLINIANDYEGVDYEKCKEFALMAKEVAEKGNYYRGVGSSLILLGRIHMQMGKDEESLTYYFQAVKICEKHNMPIGLANAYAQISAVYQDQKEKWPAAYEYLQKALEINTRTGFTKGIYDCYFRLQQLLALMGRYDESLDYGFKALAMANNETNKNSVYINLGYGYKEMKLYDKAMEYADKALPYFQGQKDNDYAMAEIFRLKSLAYIAKRDYANAEKFIHIAIEKYQRAGAFIDLPAFYNDIAQMYKERGDYRNSSDWFEKTKALNDSLTSAESTRQMAEMEAKYQAGQKELKIQEQKAAILYEKQIRNSIIGIAVLVLLIAGVLYYNVRKVRKLNKQLVELNAVKNKLFSIVSHDLRSPLSTLQTFLMIFKQADLTPEKRQSYLEKLQSTLENTSQLLDNLLHWSATQMNSIQPRKEKVDVRSIAEESFDLIKTQAEHKRIVLENRITPTAIAMADENMLRVVFRNLLSNSIKFTPEGGYVTIAGVTEKGHVRISVKDTGIGMDKETSRMIFDSGQAQSRYGTRNEKGFGIGLQLCKDYIEKNGGTMNVESEEGKGSTFYFTLAQAN